MAEKKIVPEFDKKFYFVLKVIVLGASFFVIIKILLSTLPATDKIASINFIFWAIAQLYLRYTQNVYFKILNLIWFLLSMLLMVLSVAT